MRTYDDELCAQKTIMAFIVGIMIGGLLVWVFSTKPEECADCGMEGQVWGICLEQGGTPILDRNDLIIDCIK